VSRQRSEFRHCRNRARWYWFSDKFVGAYAKVCTTCLLAFFEDGMSHAELIHKSWIWRGRCCISHSENYIKNIECRNSWYLNEDRRKYSLIFGEFGEFRSFVEVASIGHGMEYKFDVQVEWGNDVKNIEKFRLNAVWLGEQFARRLDPGTGIRLEGVRFMQSSYVLCFKGKDGDLHRIRAPKDLIDDMRDPEKPKPETKGRFSAWVDGEVRKMSRSFEMVKGKG